MQGRVVDSGVDSTVGGKEGNARCCARVELLLALPYALGSRDLRDRVQVCVCVVGAACRAFWRDLGRAIECSVVRGHRLGVRWLVCHRWPSECCICAYDSWERRPLGLG